MSTNELNTLARDLKELHLMEITTRKYIHATDEMQRQSLEIMNRMYQAK